MSLNRFDQAKPFLTLGIIVFAWLLLPVAVKSFLRVAFFELQAPVQVTASYVRDLQEFWAERSHSKDELIEAAHDLRHVYAGYEFQAQQTDSQQAEITRLERLLRLPSDPHYRFEPARVCRRDLSGWWQQLTIRKGANYDLPVGAPVVYGGGVVGYILQSGAWKGRKRLRNTWDEDMLTSVKQVPLNIEK